MCAMRLHPATQIYVSLRFRFFLPIFCLMEIGLTIFGALIQFLIFFDLLSGYMLSKYRTMGI